MKMNIIILFLIFMATIGCEKEKGNVNDPDLTGYWINLSHSKDTLLIKDSLILRSYFGEGDTSLGHKYKYKIKEDSIMLDYLGPNKVAFAEEPWVRKYQLTNNQLLQIENFNSVYPSYTGNKFKYIKNHNHEN